MIATINDLHLTKGLPVPRQNDLSGWRSGGQFHCVSKPPHIGRTGMDFRSMEWFS